MFYCKMKSKKERSRTVFLCLNGCSILGAGKSLQSLYDKTIEMHQKSYYFYHRRMKGTTEINEVLNGNLCKIIKYEYS